MPGTSNSGGRNRRSAPTHVLRGTFRADRHEDVPAVIAPTGRPAPPKPLEGDAQAEWDRMIARLEQCGTLSIVDDGALYQYVQLFAETEGIAVTQAETAETIRILQENLDGLGKKVTFDQILEVAQELAKLRKLEAGYITKVRQGRMALRMLLTEFGLTPASRARVKGAGTQKPKSKVEKFQSRKERA